MLLQSMGTFLRIHNRLELLHPLHDFRLKHAFHKLPPSPSSATSTSICRLRPVTAGAATTAAPSTFLDLVPETKKETLDFDLPRYDTSSPSPTLDLAVVGGGPAGLAVAQQVSAAGLSVCAIDPSPEVVWPNNYGVWVDEFDALGLTDCLDATWPGAIVYVDEDPSSHKLLTRPYARVARHRLKSRMMSRCVANGVKFHQAKVVRVVHEDAESFLVCSDGTTIKAKVVLDATGFSRCLVRYDKPYNPGYQVAYGILAEVDDHPFDLDRMVFMDWRDSHLNGMKDLKERNSRIPTFLYAMPFSKNRIFLEETSLVARPGLAMEDIQRRMVARLDHLGIRIRSIEEDERCVIPMGGPLPVLPQRVLGIGGTAGLVHPSTGYMVARTLAAAPIVADAIVKFLDSPVQNGLSGDQLSAQVWKDLWPIERRRQREFFCFGMDILLKLDLAGTRRFFDAFFDLEPRYWHGFLSSRLFLPELVLFGLALFSHASNTSRLEIMAKGTLPLVNMIGNLVKEKDL